MASLNLMLILNIYCIVHLLDYSLVFPLREPLSVRKRAAAHFYSFFSLFSLSLFSFFKHFSLSLSSRSHSSPGNRRPGSKTNSFPSYLSFGARSFPLHNSLQPDPQCMRCALPMNIVAQCVATPLESSADEIGRPGNDDYLDFLISLESVCSEALGWW